MPNYKKMYFQLAAKIADAVELLTEAQQKGEDIYLQEKPLEKPKQPDSGKQKKA